MRSGDFCCWVSCNGGDCYVRFVFFVMVGVRYHLDLREIEGNVVGAFSEEKKGGKGLGEGLARRGAVWGDEGLAQPHSADSAWGSVWRSSHSLTVFFLQWWFQFQVPHVREFEFEFELDFTFFIFFLSCCATSTFYIILIKLLV